MHSEGGWVAATSPSLQGRDIAWFATSSMDPCQLLPALLCVFPFAGSPPEIHKTEGLEDGRVQLQLGLRQFLAGVSELVVELYLRYL